jgi:hypothetical protein
MIGDPYLLIDSRHLEKSQERSSLSCHCSKPNIFLLETIMNQLQKDGGRS